MDQIRTLAVIDDDEAVRRSLGAILSAHGHAVESFASGESLLEAGDVKRFACLLMDLQMPGRSGLDVIRELTRRNSLPPTIVITGHATVGIAVEAMKLGAVDFLEKPYGPEELIGSVERATSGPQLSVEVGSAVIELQRLAPRQVDVLKCLMKGLPNKIIAHELGLSVRTIEHYRAGLMTRVGARTLPELVRRGIAAGL